MGSRNVTAALMYWPDLDPWARVLLVHMAVIALDNDRNGRPARLYYGGRRAMAEALYGRLPAESATDYESVMMLRNRYSTTSRTLHRLVDAGAVKLARTHSPGHSREWLLVLGIGDAADT